MGKLLGLGEKYFFSCRDGMERGVWGGGVGKGGTARGVAGSFRARNLAGGSRRKSAPRSGAARESEDPSGLNDVGRQPYKDRPTGILKPAEAGCLHRGASSFGRGEVPPSRGHRFPISSLGAVKIVS